MQHEEKFLWIYNMQQHKKSLSLQCGWWSERDGAASAAPNRLAEIKGCWQDLLCVENLLNESAYGVWKRWETTGIFYLYK